MTQIDFDEENHIYSHKGVKIPSVTQILQNVGVIQTTYYNDWDATRGTFVHKAVHLYEKGTLDESTLDEHTQPYLEQYKRFKKILEKDMGFVVRGSEQLVYYTAGDKILYCGTVDMIATLNNKTVLIDLKTNNAPKWGGLQTWAYKEAYEQTNEIVISERYLLVLKEPSVTGVLPKLKKLEGDFYDEKVWNAAVTIEHYKG